MSKKEQDSAKVIDIRTKLLERIKLSDSGVMEGEKDEIAKVYVETLPEGITEEQVKAIDHHNKLFVAGAAGTSVRAAEILNANKELATVNYEVPMYGSSTVQIMASRDDLNVGVTTKHTNAKAGALKEEFANFFAALDKEESEG